MAGLRFEFDVFGNKQIAREFQRFEHTARDMRPAFKLAYAFLIEQEREQFDSEGHHASGGWAKLKDSTIAAKAAAGLDPRILHATLALRDSLTKMGGAGQIHVLLPSSFAFGTDIPYARYHSTGTTTMPKRRPIQLKNEARRQIMKIIQRHIVAGRTRAY